MTQPESRPIRGLVLAGGGAKGAYQIGAYQALQEIGWMPGPYHRNQRRLPERSALCRGQSGGSCRALEKP